MDIGRAVRHPLEDQAWPSKLGIGALIALVPILNFALFGYGVDHLRNTANGRDVPLPTWDSLGQKFMDGLKLFVISFVLSLPLILLSCIFSLATGGIAALSGGGDEVQGAAAAGIGVLGLALGCLALLYSLILAYITPVVYIQYTRTKEIGACLRIGEMLGLTRRNSGSYIMIFLVIIGMSIVMSLVVGVLGIIPCLGWILALIISLLLAPYFTVLVAHLCGQYAQESNIVV
jgi:hypothetical protein